MTPSSLCSHQTATQPVRHHTTMNRQHSKLYKFPLGDQPTLAIDYKGSVWKLDVVVQGLNHLISATPMGPHLPVGIASIGKYCDNLDRDPAEDNGADLADFVYEALTHEGTLFSARSNPYELVWNAVNFPLIVEAISCGHNHVVYRDSLGGVWGKGCNDGNQIAPFQQGKSFKIDTPTRIGDSLGNTTALATYYSTIILSGEGKLSSTMELPKNHNEDEGEFEWIQPICTWEPAPIVSVCVYEGFDILIIDARDKVWLVRDWSQGPKSIVSVGHIFDGAQARSLYHHGRESFMIDSQERIWQFCRKSKCFIQRTLPAEDCEPQDGVFLGQLTICSGDRFYADLGELKQWYYEEHALPCALEYGRTNEQLPGEQFVFSCPAPISKMKSAQLV